MANPTGSEAETKPSRRLLRLSLRGLMLLVLVLAVVLGWVVRRARVQREAVAALRNSGWKVLYDWERTPGGGQNPNGQPRGPKWLVDRLGVDYLNEVVIVMAGIGRTATEADFENFGRFDKLEGLYAGQVNGVTDASVAHLRGLAFLNHLRLGKTEVTGACLTIIRGMTRLKHLDLEAVPLTDADLANLEGLTGLETLNLTSTPVTDAGLAHLEGLVNLKQLHLATTGIRGEGLGHLGRMTQLERLWLTRSKVDDLSPLASLPGLKWLFLDGTPIDDAQLDHLSRLPALEALHLSGTKITDAGLTRLLALKATLKGLRLSGTRVTDAGTSTLLALENLTALQLADTKVTDATLDRIAALKNLRNFEIKGAAVTDEGVARLRKALPGLRTTQEMVDASNARARTRGASNSPPINPAPGP
jgi:internalin A